MRLCCRIPTTATGIFIGVAGGTNDRIHGNNADLTSIFIDGGLGNDSLLRGGGGADTIFGGDGIDRLEGQDGNDRLDGGSEDDVLVGGDGDDTLIGGAGDDQLHGQNGNDFIIGGDADQIFASAGDDFIELDGLPDGAFIDGGTGIDTLDLSKLSTGANINLSDGVVDVSGFVSQFTEVEVIIGSSHSDTIQGTSISDTLIGGDGSDLISGGLGSDTIIGGQGDDLLLGGDGDDLFIGSDGDNTILGGDGTDTVKFEKNLSEFSITLNLDQSISVTDASQNSGSTILTEVEFLEFSDGIHSVNDFISFIQVNPDGVGTVNSFGTPTGDIFVLGNGFVPVSFDDELITNGGFESGNNSGWIQRDTGSGSFFVHSGTRTPLISNPTVGAASGNFYAVTSQSGPGSHVIAQNIFVDANATVVTLSFDMFANNRANLIIGSNLTTNSANQHARVDLLRSGADLFSTSGIDVIRNFFIGDDSGPNPNLTQVIHLIFLKM